MILSARSDFDGFDPGVLARASVFINGFYVPPTCFFADDVENFIHCYNEVHASASSQRTYSTYYGNVTIKVETLH